VNLPSIGPLVLAGVTSSVGAFYLLFYLKWRGSREHLPFALLCFTVAAYDAFSAGLYEAASVADGIFWQRLQFITLAFVSSFTIWFLELVTGRRVGRVGWWLIASLALLTVLTLVLDAPGITLSVATPSVKSVAWGGRDLVTYHESRLGLVNSVGMALVYLAYAYLFRHLYAAYRQDRSVYLLGIMLGQVTYFIGLVSDGLVATGALAFFYVSEYTYLVVIMTMSYALLGRFVDLHVSVGQLNASLEQRVSEALTDLKILRGLLPICAACKRIRDDQGHWTRIDDYITEHSEVTLSHGICPECVQRLYPEFAGKVLPDGPPQ
jgi:hypothetical protein